MKLTSKKLKRLIREEIKNLDYAYKKTKLDDFTASHPSDVKAKEDAYIARIMQENLLAEQRRNDTWIEMEMDTRRRK